MRNLRYYRDCLRMAMACVFSILYLPHICCYMLMVGGVKD